MIDIADKLGTITDLAAIPVDYRVLTENEDTQLDWTPVNLKEGMRVFPVIDTTTGTWSEGTYKLYIRPHISPEAPVLGPIEFGIS
jgi:hypothetical protein